MEVNGLGHHEVLAAVPARAVEEHHEPLVGKSVADRAQVSAHLPRTRPGRGREDRTTVTGAHRPPGIEVLAGELAPHRGTEPRRGPARPQGRDQPEAGLVLEKETDTLPARLRDFVREDVAELFL